MARSHLLHSLHPSLGLSRAERPTARSGSAGFAHLRCAAFGYTKVRGYHPQVATCAQTGMVLFSRLRGGSAGAARGAKSFLTETAQHVPSRQLVIIDARSRSPRAGRTPEPGHRDTARSSLDVHGRAGPGTRHRCHVPARRRERLLTRDLSLTTHDGSHAASGGRIRSSPYDA